MLIKKWFNYLSIILKLPGTIATNAGHCCSLGTLGTVRPNYGNALLAASFFYFFLNAFFIASSTNGSMTLYPVKLG